MLHKSSYSETSLLGSPKTSNDTLNFSKQQCLKYQKNPVIGHPNINFLRKKFTGSKELILNKTDVFFISEGKLDNTFPNVQFQAKDTECFERTETNSGVRLFYF